MSRRTTCLSAAAMYRVLTAVSCEPEPAAACGGYTGTVDGRTDESCTTSLDECAIRRNGMMQSRDYFNVGPCLVKRTKADVSPFTCLVATEDSMDCHRDRRDCEAEREEVAKAGYQISCVSRDRAYCYTRIGDDSLVDETCFGSAAQCGSRRAGDHAAASACVAQ